MMLRQLKVGERLQPFTGTTGQGQAAMLVIAVVDIQFLVRDLLASLEHDRAFIVTMLVKPRFGLLSCWS